MILYLEVIGDWGAGSNPFRTVDLPSMQCVGEGDFGGQRNLPA